VELSQSRRRCGHRGEGILGTPPVQLGDRLEQTLAITQREAELAKVRVA
jgi:hypothetical protein